MLGAGHGLGHHFAPPQRLSNSVEMGFPLYALDDALQARNAPPTPVRFTSMTFTGTA